jgi:hypothetical protein
LNALSLKKGTSKVGRGLRAGVLSLTRLPLSGVWKKYTPNPTALADGEVMSFVARYT